MTCTIYRKGRGKNNTEKAEKTEVAATKEIEFKKFKLCQVMAGPQFLASVKNKQHNI
jgi:hypothetical protein